MALTRRLVKGQALTAAEHDANIDHFEQNPNGIYIPKSASVGIKIDETAPDWGWHDLHGVPLFDPNNVNNPSMVNYIGAISQLQMDVGDEFTVNMHIPHDYAVGTDLYIHTHWSHNVLGVTSGGVIFDIDGTYAKGHNQAAFGTPISVTINATASTTRYQHMVSEVQFSNNGGTAGLLDSAEVEVDGILFFKLSLTANSMDGGAKPFLHFLDLHYQSTGVATKQKAPDFYT